MKKKTGKQYTPEIAKRFLVVMQEVIKDGFCSNKKEFGESIGIMQQNLHAIENMDRAPTLEQAALTCDKYGYSPTWLILGKGSRKSLPKEDKTVDERITELEVEVARIKRVLKK